MLRISQNIRVAVDAVIFGYQEQELFILLIKQRFGKLRNKWALPGGFVHDEESLRDAVNRELKEETGITTNYLEQLYTFGDDVKRDPRGRVISIGYVGLVSPAALKLAPSGDAKDARWFAISEIPTLAFDHSKIIDLAHQRLRTKLQYKPIGFQLLKREFPFSDLENLYCTILGREIDRRNFRKKILSLDLLVETDKKVSIGPGRPAHLFKFNRAKYKRSEENGSGFNINLA